VALIVVATIQLIAPGLGDSWFGTNYLPGGWEPSQKWVYLLTEALPVLCFVAVGVLFWALGSRTRHEIVQVSLAEPEPVD
jgi:glutamate:GABA antiporter